MQSNQRQKVHWEYWCFCWCMMISLSQVHGQSFEEALQAGQVIKLEWVQQQLRAKNGREPQPTPLFPDELQPGESEIRLGLKLRSVDVEDRLVAEVTYVNYLEIPTLEESRYGLNLKNSLRQPIILDTRFQDVYFDPKLFLFDVFSQQTLPLSCQLESYQQFLDQFIQVVEQSGAATDLLEAQLAQSQKTALPSSLSASSLSTFFCQLLEMEVPAQESPTKLQSRKQKDIYRVDYIQVDHPPKVCVIKGSIESPATEQVRIKFFQEGAWLDYWQDSLLQLNNKGDFQFSFPLDHSRMVSLFHGYQSMFFYLEPGDTLQFSTNANAFYREMQVEGRGQAENEFLLDFYHQMRGDTLYKSYDYDLLQEKPSTFFQKVEIKESKELAFLSQRSISLRPDFITMMERMLKLEHASTQWQAAHRFMREKRLTLEPEHLYYLQKKANLLYRLPREKTFDFNVEDFLNFQFYFLQNIYQSPRLGAQEEWALAQLLPSKETFVRHTVMQLFRRYTQLGKLTPSGQWQLTQLLAITRDSQWVQEMTVFAEGERNLAPDVGYRILQKGVLAPSWSSTDKEGVKVELGDFEGKKLLLHIGWVDNLDVAMTDIQYLRETQDQLPEIVHLLTASSKDLFTKRVTNQQGLFIFLPRREMERLREDYLIDNTSNHYFLIGEDGKVLANHYDLGTARKLRGTWEKMAELPVESNWTAEKKLQFWQRLGIGALFLLLVSGAVLWRRRIIARRDQRRRQLLEIELRSIRSQMNPHFLFNAMSSIQNLIRKQEQEKADIYLGEFAGLMRKTLRNTAEEYIPLIDEIEALEQYCSLESLRHPFQYEFKIAENIDVQNTYIPSMILQPILENAIIHGLAPQVAARVLLVEIALGKEGLDCTVTDNGIGILAAQEELGRKNHKSLGMKLVRQRLELMGLNKPEHLTIRDRSTFDPPAQGTLVSLIIPIEQ